MYFNINHIILSCSEHYSPKALFRRALRTRGTSNSLFLLYRPTQPNKCRPSANFALQMKKLKDGLSRRKGTKFRGGNVHAYGDSLIASDKPMGF